MSELQQRHTFYELREQYIAEGYWPVGEAAENLRALFISNRIANRISYSAEIERQNRKIWEMLIGKFKPARAAKKGVTKEQMKQAFGL